MFKKNRKTNNTEITLKKVALTKNGKTTIETMDTDYLRWFIENGKDLEYDTVTIES